MSGLETAVSEYSYFEVDDSTATAPGPRRPSNATGSEARIWMHPRMIADLRADPYWGQFWTDVRRPAQPPRAPRPDHLRRKQLIR